MVTAALADEVVSALRGQAALRISGISIEFVNLCPEADCNTQPGYVQELEKHINDHLAVVILQIPEPEDQAADQVIQASTKSATDYHLEDGDEELRKH